MPEVQQVLSVERIQPLQEKARARLRLLKIHNVQLRLADGGLGWPDNAPFDGILSAAAPREVPRELIDQLADGGRLVIPVGEDGEQQLTVIDKSGDEIISTTIEPVRFVPLLSGVVKR
jgi:protein-L-isoaspartate(D-aspartate) O-methyltransferase